MKKIIKSEYKIKLDFERNTENPSRLFRSFSEMIDGLNNLDIVIAQCVNSTVESKIYLDDIEKGSILGKFWNELVINQDGQIDDIVGVDKIEEFIEDSRIASLQFIADNKSTVKDLEGLKETISEIAKKVELIDKFNFAEPDIINLAKSINKVNNATKGLTAKESFSLASKNKEVKEIGAGTPEINIEAVEEALTENTYQNIITRIYKIKKPDFLGDSAWVFKFGPSTLNVKILHEVWLEKFQNGEVIVLPGDSLKVSVRQTSKYNINGYLISDKLEIIEVLDVIHNH